MNRADGLTTSSPDDDIAALAKLTAASVDDIAGAAGRASAETLI